jgi:hypothetical protein
MKAARTSSARPPDPTVYPVEDEVGEEIIQRWICELLRPLLARFLAERGVRAFVGADQFFYWRQFDPRACVAPDVYVLPDVAPDTAVKVWKVWEDHVVPSLALEIVSDDPRKDCARSPERHAELGTQELVIFDPHRDEGPGRVRFQLYRRTQRGGFAQVLTTDADRVRSRALGCHLRAVGEGAAQRLRIATGGRGDVLYPTDGERAVRAEAELARLRAAQPRSRRRR